MKSLIFSIMLVAGITLGQVSGPRGRAIKADQVILDTTGLSVISTNLLQGALEDIDFAVSSNTEVLGSNTASIAAINPAEGVVSTNSWGWLAPTNTTIQGTFDWIDAEGPFIQGTNIAGATYTNGQWQVGVPTEGVVLKELSHDLYEDEANLFTYLETVDNDTMSYFTNYLRSAAVSNVVYYGDVVELQTPATFTPLTNGVAVTPWTAEVFRIKKSGLYQITSYIRVGSTNDTTTATGHMMYLAYRIRPNSTMTNADFPTFIGADRAVAATGAVFGDGLRRVFNIFSVEELDAGDAVAFRFRNRSGITVGIQHRWVSIIRIGDK